MFDEPKHFDQEASRIQRLIRKKAIRVLWFMMVLLIAAFQIMMFLRLRRQNVPLFHPTREMVLVVALVAVTLLGVFVKSRQGRS
jgi:hypothetical protein